MSTFLALILTFSFWVGDSFCLMNKPTTCYHVQTIDVEAGQKGMFYAEVTREGETVAMFVRVRLIEIDDGRLLIRDGSRYLEVMRKELG